MAGHHGSDHEVAAMIGFVQNRNAMDWLRTLNHWVAALGRWSIGTWTPSDALMLEKYDADGRCLFSRSSRSEAPTSELQSLMRISNAVFCLKKKTLHN